MKTNFTLAAVLLFTLVARPGYAKQAILTIGQRRAAYHRHAGFLSRTLGFFHYGDQVKKIAVKGAWILVGVRTEAGVKKGWLHRSAFANSKDVLEDVGQGKEVAKKAYSDEVVTAGKGFSPEYEAMYKKKHKNLRYDLVDKMEKITVSGPKIQAFMKAGDLHSEVLGGGR